MSPRSITHLLLIMGLLVGGLLLVATGPTIAGFYADMVLNSKAEKRGMPPVVFPHWIHRIEFKCKVCHPAIFEMRSGSNDIDMNKIINGQFCGKCHNGTIAWKPVQCARCHSGQPGLTTGPLLGVR